MLDRDPRELGERALDAPASGERAPEDPRDVAMRDVDLPRGHERERVTVGDREYRLRGSESRALATIGAFRVVPATELRDDAGRPGDLRHGDLEHLRRQGLIRVVASLDRDDRTPVLTLTERGRSMLEHHSRQRNTGPSQVFYAERVRARELSHDARVYQAFLRTAERLHAQGARVHRVVLDDELKREYQQFLQERNRGDAASDGRPTRSQAEIEEWARAHSLPLLDGHVQFPDVRLEYEWPDGRRDVEDVEVLTPHYRGAHAAAKGHSGFTGYRIGGGGSRAGGSPFDPDVASEFLR
jgi:hypothetical protein